MTRNARAFSLLAVVVIAAGTLALFVRDFNERLAMPFAGQEPSATSTLPPPAIVVIHAPTSTPPVAVGGSTSTNPAPPAATSTPVMKEFKSADGVTSVVVDVTSLPLLPPAVPFQFYGTTTAFENQASWKLTATGGKLVASGSFYVSSTDAGLPGPFEVTTEYSVTKATSGTLMIYEASAKDGTPIHVVKIPVRLEPRK